jgi:hypothetical protein
MTALRRQRSNRQKDHGTKKSVRFVEDCVTRTIVLEVDEEADSQRALDPSELTERKEGRRTVAEGCRHNGYGILLMDSFKDPVAHVQKHINAFVQLPEQYYARGLERWVSRKHDMERKAIKSQCIQNLLAEQDNLLYTGGCSDAELWKRMGAVSREGSRSARRFARRIGKADELVVREGDLIDTNIAMNMVKEIRESQFQKKEFPGPTSPIHDKTTHDRRESCSGSTRPRPCRPHLLDFDVCDSFKLNQKKSKQQRKSRPSYKKSFSERSLGTRNKSPLEIGAPSPKEKQSKKAPPRMLLKRWSSFSRLSVGEDIQPDLPRETHLKTGRGMMLERTLSKYKQREDSKSDRPSLKQHWNSWSLLRTKKDVETKDELSRPLSDHCRRGQLPRQSSASVLSTPPQIVSMPPLARTNSLSTLPRSSSNPSLGTCVENVVDDASDSSSADSMEGGEPKGMDDKHVVAGVDDSIVFNRMRAREPSTSRNITSPAPNAASECATSNKMLQMWSAQGEENDPNESNRSLNLDDLQGSWAGLDFSDDENDEDNESEEEGRMDNLKPQKPPMTRWSNSLSALDAVQEGAAIEYPLSFSTNFEAQSRKQSPIMKAEVGPMHNNSNFSMSLSALQTVHEDDHVSLSAPPEEAKERGCGEKKKKSKLRKLLDRLGSSISKFSSSQEIPEEHLPTHTGRDVGEPKRGLLTRWNSSSVLMTETTENDTPPESPVSVESNRIIKTDGLKLRRRCLLTRHSSASVLSSSNSTLGSKESKDSLRSLRVTKLRQEDENEAPKLASQLKLKQRLVSRLKIRGNLLQGRSSKSYLGNKSDSRTSRHRVQV